MINHMHNRLIAFLDVLGFSQLLRANSLEYVHNKYSKFIDEAKSKTFYTTQGDNTGRTNFEFAQFVSDSIILVSNSTTDIYNINNFVAAVSFLLETGFVSNLPLRGCIGLGDFLVDNERNIYLSQELSELVHFEAEQEWTGCSILPNAEPIIIDATFGIISSEEIKQNTTCNNPIHYYPVPLKNNLVKEMPVVNFMFFISETQIDESIKFLIEPKKENTKKYFEYLNSLQFVFQNLEKEFYPAESSVVMTTRSGCRVAFLDKNRNPCIPGVSTFEFVAIGKWK